MSRSSGIIVIVSLILLVFVVFSSGCLEFLYDSRCTDRKVVENQFTLTKEHPYAELYTPDAKKECHAEMSIEFEYTDQDLKETQDKPPIRFEFGTNDGLFMRPDPKMKSTTGIGNNVSYYWSTTTSQGAKNSIFTSVNYHVIATLPPEAALTAAGKGVLVRMEIEYTPAS